MLDSLDAAAVRRWCGRGLAALRAHQHEIDELNVYPVPDGDTGTNLVLTMTSAQEALDASPEPPAAAPSWPGGAGPSSDGLISQPDVRDGAGEADRTPWTTGEAAGNSRTAGEAAGSIPTAGKATRTTPAVGEAARTTLAVGDGSVPAAGDPVPGAHDSARGSDGRPATSGVMDRTPDEPAGPDRSRSEPAALSGEVLPESGVGATMRLMARGALLGARGNSGVIVSQILRGMADTFATTVAVRGGELARALRTASEAAYAAVAKPVEGTVLSVVAAAAEGARKTASDDLLAVARAAAHSAAEALARTPQQLPILARAGVVDAGGRGLVLLLEALVDALGPATPEPAPAALSENATARHPDPVQRPGVIGSSGSDEAFGYEVQYLLDATPAAVARLRETLAGLGDSLVVVGTGEGDPPTWNVHVHVHVDDIGAALEAGVEAGRPHRISVTRLVDAHHGPGLDLSLPHHHDPSATAPSPAVPSPAVPSPVAADAALPRTARPSGAQALAVPSPAAADAALPSATQVPPVPSPAATDAALPSAAQAPGSQARVARPADQEPHQSTARPPDPNRDPNPNPDPDARAAVVVADGDGLTAIFTAEGATIVDRNPSTAELLTAITATGAAQVVLLPNDANTHAVASAAAREAAASGVRVSVVPTRSPVQALAALAVRDPGRPFDDDVIAMAEAAGACRSGEVCTASREALTVAGRCLPGDLLGLVDGEVHVIGADLEQVCRRLLDGLLGGGGELVTLVLGADAPDGLDERLRSQVTQAWPFVEVNSYAGGQPRYHLLVGVE